MITAVYETAIIFKRELTARWGLVLVGITTALIVLVLPFMPGISHADRADVGSAAGFGFAFGSALILSIGLGATLFGRDLSEGRLGFYFERPVYPTAIVVGRFSAAYLLIILCEGLALLAGLVWLEGSPLLYLTPLEVFGSFSLSSNPRWLTWFAFSPLVVLLVSHCVSMMFRARTAWLVADLFGFSLIAPAAWLLVHPFTERGYERASGLLTSSITVVAFVALVGAVLISISQGRTDLRRTHRFLSTTLWGLLLASMGTLAGYAAWLMNVTPADLDSYFVVNNLPGGRWLEVVGSAKGHLDVKPRFLVAADGQRWVRLRTPPYGSRPETTTSSDGRIAVWRGDEGRHNLRTIWYADLTLRDPMPVATTIAVGTYDSIEVSPDGTVISVLSQDLLSLYRLSDEALITTVRVPGNHWNTKVRFPTSEIVRVIYNNFSESYLNGSPRRVAVFDLPVVQGAKLISRYVVPLPPEYQLYFDPGLKYVAAGVERSPSDEGRDDGWKADLPSRHVFDAATEEHVRAISGVLQGFLIDGRVWTTQQGPSGEVSVVITRLETGETREFVTGTAESRPYIRELAGGGLVVGSDPRVTPSGDKSYWSRVELFDPDTGSRRLIGRDLTFDAYHGPETGIVMGRYLADSTAEHRVGLFRDNKNTLFAWDPDGKTLVRLHESTE